MSPDAARPWVHTLEPRPRRLLCFPFAGGGTAAFRGWSDALPASIDVCPIQLPGRQSRLSEAPIDDLRAMVEAMLPPLLPALRRTPYALYGHSMGAWLAFELIRAMRRLRRPLPAHLFVAARRAPHLPGTHSPLGNLPREAFIEQVQARYNAIPQALLDQPRVLDLFLPALQADFRLLDTYRYVDEPPLDVPITVFYGEHDEVVSRKGLRAWQEHTTQPLQLRPIPGGHFFVTEHADLVTAAIGGALR